MSMNDDDPDTDGGLVPDEHAAGALADDSAGDGETDGIGDDGMAGEGMSSAMGGPSGGGDLTDEGTGMGRP